MKILFALLLLAPGFAHADLPSDLDYTVDAVGRGQVPYRKRCSGPLMDKAMADSLREAVQDALVKCGENVRQLAPFEVNNECQDFAGGPVTQTAKFGCIKRPDDSHNTILSSSYFTSVSSAHDILDNGFNSGGEEAFATKAAAICGGKYVRVRPFLVAAKIDSTLAPEKQMEVITTSQVYCGVEPELLK